MDVTKNSELVSMIDDLVMRYPRVQEDEVSMIGGWHSFEQPLMLKDCEHMEITQARAKYRKWSEYEERLALVKATFKKKEDRIGKTQAETNTIEATF